MPKTMSISGPDDNSMQVKRGVTVKAEAEAEAHTQVGGGVGRDVYIYPI